MHSGEGIQGCSIYTGIAGVAYMFLRLAESMQYTQQKMTDHPDQFFANLDAACLLNRAEEYGHWAKHLSNCGKHEKVQTSLTLLETICWNSKLLQHSCHAGLMVDNEGQNPTSKLTSLYLLVACILFGGPSWMSGCADCHCFTAW